MLLKEFSDLDTENKLRVYVNCLCPGCGEEYTRQKRHLRNNYSCSSKCNNILLGLSIELRCAHCNSYFYRSKSKLNNSKSGKYFCSRNCKDIAQTYMSEIRLEHYDTSNSDYRKLAFEAYLPVCNRCNYSNIHALEVHHKDKHRQNNNISNLEILCANCHSIEHRGMSRGSD